MNKGHFTNLRGCVPLLPETGLKPPAPGRRQRRAAETRLRLFRCALYLFAERGFSNVTIEQITDAADVGKGTFFNYFESKDHVLGVLAEIQLGKVKEAMLQAGQAKKAIRLVLRQLVQWLAEEPGRSPALARAVISSFLASEGVRILIERFMLEGCEMIAEVVAVGQKRGEIDPLLDRKKVALQLQRTLMGTILFWSLHGEPALSICVEDSFKHFWRAIVASGQEQEP
jgi:AcrR family transcriptional regulator